MIGSRSLGSSAQLCAHEDLKAHLVYCTQEKADRGLPGLQPETARSHLPKVEQSQGKAEVMILSSLHTLWPLSPLILWRYRRGEGKVRDRWPPKRFPGSPGVWLPSPAWTGRAGTPDTGGFRVLCGHVPFSLPPTKRAVSSPLTRAFFPAPRGQQRRETAGISSPGPLALCFLCIWAPFFLLQLHVQWPVSPLAFALSRVKAALITPLGQLFCEASLAGLTPPCSWSPWPGLFHYRITPWV